MAKKLKIFLLIFTLGIILSPNIPFFASDTTQHNICYYDNNEQHQTTETECCSTDCNECFLHTHHISVFHIIDIDSVTEKIIVTKQKVNSFTQFLLPNASCFIWQPPKIHTFI